MSKEFAEFANQLNDVECTRIEDLSQSNLELTNYDVYAGFGADLGKIDISHFNWIHSFGAGIDNFTSNKSLNNNTLISRTKGELGYKIAEYCLTYILAYLKQTGLLHQQQRETIWKKVEVDHLREKDVLIYGTGFIGKEIAKLLKPLSKSVSGINSTGKANKYFDHTYVIYDDLLRSKSFPIVINTLPLTNTTKGLFNKNLFGLLNKALFINVGRGECVVEDDLVWALDTNHISMAVLDVFKNEPLPDKNSLWQHDQVIITPHQSGITTIEDIKTDFNIALEHIQKNKSDQCFTTLKKGY